MAKRNADSKIVKLIYRLAGDPARVETTTSVYYDMLAYGLTKSGLCEAIRKWIDAGKPVIEDVTRKAKPHVGKIHYIMKPKIEEWERFIKVGIENDPNTGKHMIIISSHV